jgi:lipopolysaccharide transport system permease protein
MNRISMINNQELNKENQSPQKTHITPPSKWPKLHLGELWAYRDLLWILAWRDIKVRYKQTMLGAAWAILQPLLTMVVFSLIFGRVAQLPTEGIPYPIFTFTALLPWQLFAHAMLESGNSLVSNQQLITKVYFPRLAIPFGTLLSGLLDFAIAFRGAAVDDVVLWVTHPLDHPDPARLRLPGGPDRPGHGHLAVCLNVEYRDVRYTIPFLTQFWLFITPVAYSISIVPENLLWLYSLNPMTGVVEGFRWALLGRENFSWTYFLISTGMVAVLFLTGLAYFRKMEDSFADNI